MHPTSEPVYILLNAVENSYHLKWLNIDTIFYGQTLRSFSWAHLYLIFFLRWPNEHVTSHLLYRSKFM